MARVKQKRANDQGVGRTVLERLEGRMLMSATGQLAFSSALEFDSGDTSVGAARSIDVSVFDQNGVLETGYNGQVTVALSLYGETPAGSVTATAVNGVAHIDGINLNSQIEYQFTATDDQSDTPAVLGLETYGSATDRLQLVILQQPVVDPATGTFSMTVGVENALGQLVPNDSSGSALPPSIVINTGPTGGTLNGGDVSSPQTFGTLNPDGTVTFSGVSVSAAGDYTFTVEDATPLSSINTLSVTLPAEAPTPPPALWTYSNPTVVVDPTTSVTIGVPGSREVGFVNQSGYVTHISVTGGTAVVTFEGGATVTHKNGNTIVSGGVFIAVPTALASGSHQHRPLWAGVAGAVPDSIVVTDKNAHTKATLSAQSEGNVPASVKQITGGEMAAINAPGLELAYGNLSVSSVHRLKLGQVALSTIAIGNDGSIRPVDVALGAVDRSSLTSGANLGVLQVDSWTGINTDQDVESAGTLYAPVIGRIKSKGQFEATVEKQPIETL